ncbi:MAG: hypothetical protein POH28_08240 [Acidocella sp.]|nr:hypothetical protein [Acidocella sp.]
MTHAINLIVFLLLTVAGLVMAVTGFIDGLLASAMTAAHVPANAQTILLFIAAACLVVFAIKALGRVLAALVIVLLVLLLLHKTDPGLGMPQGHVPAWMTMPTAPHITL